MSLTLLLNRTFRMFHLRKRRMQNGTAHWMVMSRAPSSALEALSSQSWSSGITKQARILSRDDGTHTADSYQNLDLVSLLATISQHVLLQHKSNIHQSCETLVRTFFGWLSLQNLTEASSSLFLRGWSTAWLESQIQCYSSVQGINSL